MQGRGAGDLSVLPALEKAGGGGMPGEEEEEKPLQRPWAVPGGHGDVTTFKCLRQIDLERLSKFVILLVKKPERHATAQVQREGMELEKRILHKWPVFVSIYLLI